MIAYEIKVDQAQIEDARSLFEFVGGNSDDALRIAINKTSPKIRTAASAAIRTQVRLPAAYVKERMIIRKASRKNLTGAITTPSRGLLLSRFSTDPLIAGDKVGWIRPPLIPTGGIKIKIKPSGGTSGAPGLDGNRPFYMLLNKGANVGIVARIGSGRSVKVFAGPSLSQVFSTVRSDVMPEAGEELTSQLLDAMRYLLVKQSPAEPVIEAPVQ